MHQSIRRLYSVEVPASNANVAPEETDSLREEPMKAEEEAAAASEPAALEPEAAAAPQSAVPEAAAEPTGAAAEPAEATAEPSEPVEASAEPAAQPPETDQFVFEPAKAVKPMKPPERAPYYDRYYLLYGGAEVPKQMDLKGTLEFLKGYGFDNGPLKQARKGKNAADLIEKNFAPNKPGVHYCDFCGIELTGTEYDVLADGRERCTNCSRTAVRTVEEFERIYTEVKQNLESFFGAKITVPVKVQMVNAKKLHSRLGKTFIPTGKSDGRVVGVAIKSGRNDYALLLENGSPRLASAMTIAHELTHVWQYVNWDAKAIRQMYGKEQELEVYEGMAKWTEIQYAYLIGEPETAKREEISARARQDAYGTGFCKYAAKYPLSVETHLDGSTPFEDVTTPL